MWINNKGNGWFTICKSKAYKDTKECVCFLSVQFPKDSEPKGNSVNVEISKFFMSAYEKKDGTVAPKLVIQDFVTVEWNEKKQESNQVNVEDDDLPFYGG
ncbi:MAG: hypothetical protein KBT03_04030 [Bacteroidales bacterium]|nr:hypothetical protein [Candidatus Scybalousia scybalohippi]